MKIEEFTKLLKDRPSPTGKQIENLERIKEISRKFHREAGIDDGVCDFETGEKAIVLESGHQPNFFPHAGLFKKVFLLDFFKRRLKEEGKNPVALFGFADSNISTAKLLYSNRLPALTNEGYVRIGFKIAGKQKWKVFNSLEKPGPEDLADVIGNIKNAYGKGNENLEKSIKLLEESYGLAKNFSDLNAFFFSKICEFIGLEAMFFRYSDIHKNEIFLSESYELSKKTFQFNRIYNETIRSRGLNLREHGESDLPLWYNCACGGVTKLAVYSEEPLKCRGSCPLCGSEHVLDMSSGIGQHYKRMSMNSVARNIIFSEGLGTSLFISGSGGALRYGQVSSEIMRKFNINKPFALFWRSKDYYVGPIQDAAFSNLARAIGIKLDELPASVSISEKLMKRRQELEEKISELKGVSDQKQLQKYKGMYANCGVQAAIASKIFGLTPSVIDILASLNSQKIAPIWNHVISSSRVSEENGFYGIADKVEYPPGYAYLKYQDIPKLYREVEGLGGERNVR
jgi:hypothetical protein